MKPNIVFNGKFMNSRGTGVTRVAHELINAFDELAADKADQEQKVFIAMPNGSDSRMPLRRIEIRSVGFLGGLAKNIPWEQFNLPFVLHPSLLVNLCNIGPGLSRNAISMIHDAQVFITPKSYSAGFRMWYRFIMPIMGRRHRRILTVSHYSKRELVKYGVAAEDKIVVIYNGCDHVLRYEPDRSASARHGLEPKGFVLALSNAQHHKNIAVLLEAFKSGELADTKLALFGAATRQDFEARGHEVPGNVVFLGPVTDEELAGLMTEALAFACPSLTEGFGLPPLEAMLLGCPAVVAPCGALPEVCEAAVLYADPADPGQWSANLAKLAEDMEFREDMIVSGRRQAEKFTWARSASGLMNVIDEVADKDA